MVLAEQFRLEAPSVLWRAVGATAVFSLANVLGSAPQSETFLGHDYDTWEASWVGDNGGQYLLRVREDEYGYPGPSSLVELEPTDESGMAMYTRYLFSADPETQEDAGYLAVFRGQINPNTPEGRALQTEQMKIEVGLGTARSTVHELADLHILLGLGVIHLVQQQHESE